MPENKPKHSHIGASSMSRWANCPGSVLASAGLPNKSSVVAQEGTAAHELIGLALERAISQNIPIKEVLENIMKAITLYGEYIQDLKESIPNCVVHIEHGFDMSDIYPDLYGTADGVVYDPNKKILYVIDYKHGAGLPVEVEFNMQLLYYALGALWTLKYPAREVEIAIVQPRCYHSAGLIRKWRIPVTDLIDFKADLVEYAKETEKKGATLKAGSHCMFCLAKPKCDAHKNMNVQEAKREFKFYSDPAKDFEVVK